MPAKHDKEDRDFYIAMIVGGLGLILILLWLFTPSAVAATAPATGDVFNNPLTETMPPGASTYDYNVPAYDPSTPILNAAGGAGGIGTGAGGGCCSGNIACGGAGVLNNVTVAQYQTLI